MQFGKILKTFTSKKGNQVVFRYPVPEDVDDALTFVNELIREDIMVQISGREWTREEEQKFFDQVIEDMLANKKRMVIVLVNGAYAGSGRVDRQTYRKQHIGTVGISLAKVVRSEGIGTELFKTLIEEAKDLGLAQLELSCFENNTQACALYKKIGFQTAGIIPNAIKYKDRFVGEIKMYLPLQ